MSRLRVAVIGGGVSGLTAAHLLRWHYDVTVFDADDRLGGHAHTHDVTTADGREIGVDSGFIVHNARTYPNLLRLFGELGVSTQDTEMSLGVRCLGCGLEYAGAKRLGGLFARPGNLARPAYLAMLAQVPRFHRWANQLLDAPDAGDEPTFGEFLERGRFTSYFVEHFALPLVSAVWSSDLRTSRAYPARYLFAFLRHHGMLSVTGSPVWKTVVGGSREYVRRIADGLEAVHVATPVRSVRRLLDGVEVRDEADRAHRVDRAVLACHADQALELLADPAPVEKEVLGVFDYAENETWLHTDPAAVLPASPRARASWNHLKPGCRAESGRVRVSYDMNRLMRLAEPEDYLVTLNGAADIRPERVLARMTYRHPTYTPTSVAAQRRLDEIGDERLRFAGAYHGWGFHEDGCASGVRAAEAFGAGW